MIDYGICDVSGVAYHHTRVRHKQGLSQKCRICAVKRSTLNTELKSKVIVVVVAVVVVVVFVVVVLVDT